MAAGEEPLGRTVLPLIGGTDWRRASADEVRRMSKTFGITRGIAGFAVLGLAGLLVQSSWKPGVVFLILFVSTYNSLGLIAFYRGSNQTVVSASRIVSACDVTAFFVMLWSFGPVPPGPLIACYVAILNVAIAVDGVVGGAVWYVLFLMGYGALAWAGAAFYHLAFPISDFVLWAAVVAVMAVSTGTIQQILSSRPAPAEPGVARFIPAPTFRLSPREREVLQLVAEGYSNTMIANRLHLSENTIKGYVEGLLTRLNARNRAEAVAAASRMNLI